MPTYVYKFVETGETIEVQQAFSDPTLTELAHPADGVVRAVKKVFQPVGITFKGSGFYKTDSRGAKASASTTPATKTDGTSSGDSAAAAATPAATPAPAAASTSSTS
jgi:predicted nucleic acid-binding Zn ribbon protein